MKIIKVYFSITTIALLGIAHADDLTADSKGRAYRQEVRSRLNGLQAMLDGMVAQQQLTTDQYQQEGERVHSLKVQIHADASQDDPMTKDERNNDLSLVRQMTTEAQQWAAASTTTLTTPNLPVTYPAPPTTAPMAMPIPPVPPVPPNSQNSTLANLQLQYTMLNNQYQNIDNQYGAAVTARDLQTANSLMTQLKALHQQMENVQLQMQAQIANP
jgi:hypothetical protein